MSAPRSETPPACSERPDHPYPSWSAIANAIGSREAVAAQEQRAAREARIWRELAEEPPAALDDPMNRARLLGSNRR